MASLVSRLGRLSMIRVQILNSSYCTHARGQLPTQSTATAAFSTPHMPIKGQFQNPDASRFSGPDSGIRKLQIGDKISRQEKNKFIISALLDIEDNKETIYGTLDAWVAWEQDFPIASIKMILASLEKQYQWHRIVQVIKWMLSKGQGVTNGTYGQLIRALDMDHRAEEAHKVWMKKIGNDDLHSVPWELCRVMISVYHRNHMLDRLVKLFGDLEAFSRKPTDKSIVQKVADAYEMLGRLEEKNRVLEKYKDLFSEASTRKPKKFRKASSKKKNESGQINPVAVASVEEVPEHQKVFEDLAEKAS